MKKKLFSLLFALIILMQGFIFLPLNANNQIDKLGSILIEESSESAEVIPNISKTTKRVTERILEYNISSAYASVELNKGYSPFYIHSKLIPKTLALHKIHSTFFTSYFSTSV